MAARLAFTGCWMLDVGCWMFLLLALASVGCVSKTKAQNQERAAYLRGQQEAMVRMQQMQTQGQGPCVTVNGEVRTHVVPWTEGMTLAKALVAADYIGASDPAQIIILRNGVGKRVEPRKLFSGEDIPLQPGDVVHLLPQYTPPNLQTQPPPAPATRP
jgi:hypothetical protein